MKHDYHFEGIGTDGRSRYCIIGGKTCTDLGEARDFAKRRMEDGKYKSIEIFVYDKRIVEVVE